MKKILIMLILVNPSILFAQIEDDSKGGRIKSSNSSSSSLNSIGVQMGWPIFMSSGLAGVETGPTFGISYIPPMAFSAGVMVFGVRTEVGGYHFDPDYRGIVLLGHINAKVLETSIGNVLFELGTGFIGASACLTSSARFDYPLSNSPLTISPYVRSFLVNASSSGENGDVIFLNFGLDIRYRL